MVNDPIVTVIGTSFDDAIAQAKLRYGTNIRVLKQRERETGGLFGVGSRKSYEVDVWINPPTKLQATPVSSNENKIEVRPKSSEESNLLQALIEKVTQLEESNTRALNRSNQQYHLQQEDTTGELGRIRSILIDENDFSALFADELILDIKKSLYGNELEDGLLVEEETLKELGRRMSFFKSTSRHKPKVFILVGTTGVGKTTTIVKIATVNLMSNPDIDIRLVNMDNYKIGAKEQLDTYAAVLQRPVITIFNTAKDLKMAVEDTKDADLILVDTSGSSPQEIVRLADLKMALDHFGSHSEVHLALSASTKESDIRDILANFELFRCKSVVLTKMDETRRIGSVIAPLIEKRIPISYVTTGQNAAPKEIERATIATIWRKLNGFSSSVMDKILRQLEENN